MKINIVFEAGEQDMGKDFIAKLISNRVTDDMSEFFATISSLDEFVDDNGCTLVPDVKIRVENSGGKVISSLDLGDLSFDKESLIPVAYVVALEESLKKALGGPSTNQEKVNVLRQKYGIPWDTEWEVRCGPCDGKNGEHSCGMDD